MDEERKESNEELGDRRDGTGPVRKVYSTVSCISEGKLKKKRGQTHTLPLLLIEIGNRSKGNH